MCLDTVDKEVRQVKDGYKVVHLTDGDFFTICYRTEKPLPAGEWLDEADYARDENDLITTFSFGVYPRGWHSYITREDAGNSGFHFDAIVKVKIKEVLASGTQWGNGVVVSRFIKIVEVLK